MILSFHLHLYKRQLVSGMIVSLMKMTVPWVVSETRTASQIPSLRLTALGYFREKRDIIRRRFTLHALGFVFRGEGFFRTPQGKKRVTAPFYFSVAPGHFSEYGPAPEDSWEERYVIFSGTRVREWSKAGWLPSPDQVFALAHSSRWADLHQNLAEAVQMGDRREMDRLKLEFERAIYELHQQRLSDSHTVASRKQAFDRLVEEWRTRPHITISLPETARKFSLSYSRFRAEFRSVVGTSPYQVLLHFRLERAAQALSDTDRPIKEIAWNNGFTHVEAFNRAFRAHFHQTPGDYRRRHSLRLE